MSARSVFCGIITNKIVFKTVVGLMIEWFLSQNIAALWSV